MKLNSLCYLLGRKLCDSIWSKSMFLLSFLFFSAITILSQPKIDVLGLAKGDSVVIISAIAPKADEGINFYRKNTSGQFVLLNTDGPIRPVTDREEIIRIIGDKWKEISSSLSINDPLDIVYSIAESEANFIIMALNYPEIFKIAGCWYVDTNNEGLREGEYKLDYLDKDKKIKKSVTKKFNLKETQPVVPTSLSYENKDVNIQLKWDYPKWKGDFSDLATQFYVYKKSQTGDFKRINKEMVLRSESDSPIYFDNEVEGGIEYTYYVTAVDIIGVESSPSQTVTAMWLDKVPPAIPDEVKADSVDGNIGLSWKMNVELDAKGYNVYRSTERDKEFIKLNKQLVPVEKSYFFDKDFRFGIQYFYSITCIDNNGNESEKSNLISIVYEDLIPPEPPTNLTYKVEDKLIKLNWTASVSDDVDGYHIYRGELKSVLPRLTADPIKSVSFTDSGYTGKGFPPGERFTVAVTAFDYAGNESPQVIIENIFIPDDEAPIPPEGLMVENIDGNSIEISCGGSSSADVAVYKLFKSELGSSTPPIEIASYHDVPYFLTDTTARKPKTYIYYAIAIDSTGNKSEPSRMDTVEFKDYTPPPSPRQVIATQVEGGIEIMWEPVYDYDLAGYNVYKSDLPNGIFEKINPEILQELKFLDKEGKSTDFYTVRAIDTSGNESTMGDYASPE